MVQMNDKKIFLRKTNNLPYLDVINFRLGNYPLFKKIMLNSISTKPALKEWTNRTDRDWGVLLIEMWAYLSDILSYYQERVINEAFLRTSVLDESTIELFHHMNHKPIPGISSNTLAFFETNDDQSGTIPKNFKIQSSGTDTLEPQTFETDQETEISSDCNQMSLSDSKTVSDLEEDTYTLTLDKVYETINSNDFILITDEENENVSRLSEKNDTNEKTTIIWDPSYALDQDYDIRATKILKFSSELNHFAYDAPPPPFGRIKGRISGITRNLIGKQHERESVSHVTVELIDPIGKNTIAESITDKYGNFSFYKVFPGSYKFRIVRREYWNWLSWPRKQVISSPIQVLPAQQSQIELKFKSIELLTGSDIDYRNKLMANVISSEPFTEIERAIISSNIFLDGIYPEILPETLLILSKDYNTPFDRINQVYRIKDLEVLHNSGYGISKDVTRLDLTSFENENLLEKAFCWDDLPDSVPKKPTLRHMLKESLKKSKMAKKLKKQATKQLMKQVKTGQKTTTKSMPGGGKGKPPKFMKSATKGMKPKPAKMLKEAEKKAQQKLEEEESELSPVYDEIIPFLKNNINVSWLDSISDEDIIKDKNKNLLRIISEGHFLEMKLNFIEGEGSLTIDDERTYDLYLNTEEEKLYLYWDKVQGPDFRVTNSSVFVNPDFELKTDPQAPSLKHTSKENNLTIEGSHPSLKPGSYLSISDDSSTCKGQFLDENLKPITRAQLRLYSIKIKNEKKFLKLFSSQHQHITNIDGYFSFPQFAEDDYIIGAFMPTIPYWKQIIQKLSVKDHVLIQKINRAVVEQSNQTTDRSVHTATAILEQVVPHLTQVLHNEQQKVPFFETNIQTNLDDLKETTENLEELRPLLDEEIKNLFESKQQKNKEMISFYTESILEYLFPQLRYEITTLGESVQKLEELTSSRKLLSISTPLKEIVHTFNSGTKIIQIAIAQISNILNLPLRNDKLNECCLGTTQEIFVKRNSDMKIFIKTNLYDKFNHTSSFTDTQSLEIVKISNVAIKPGKTFTTFEPPLKNSYLRGYAILRSNIIPVSNGQTVANEILGSGNAADVYQQFSLQQQPLTYLPSIFNPTEPQSSLNIFIDGEKWKEKNDLLHSSSFDKHFTTSIDEDNNTIISFGDGIHGSKPPNGSDNIVASYRIGTGSEGNIAANTLTNPMDNQPSIKSITNLIHARGGFNEPPIKQKNLATANIQTLGKAVSLDDYTNLAKSITFVAKAKTTMQEIDGIESLKLIVAPRSGTTLDTLQKSRLRRFLDSRRDVNIPLQVESFKPVPIEVEIDIHIKDDYIRSEVSNSVTSSLKPNSKDLGTNSFFSFEQFDFGQNVSLSGIYRVVEKIPGISYAVVKKFRRSTSGKMAEDVILIDDNEIVQCNGDPEDPTGGILKINAFGGIEL